MPPVKSKPKPTDTAKQRGARKARERKARPQKSREGNARDQKEPAAEPTPEVNGQAAPPPAAVEPDPELTPEQAEQARKKYLLRRFWISGRGYWGRHGDKLAWPFTVLLLVLIVVNVGFQYGINVWNRAFFDAIEQRNVSTVYMLSAVFVPLVAGSASLVVAQVYLRMTIQRRWRSWRSWPSRGICGSAACSSGSSIWLAAWTWPWRSSWRRPMTLRPSWGRPIGYPHSGSRRSS